MPRSGKTGRSLPLIGERIILATVGSLGDLHPFLAIALALQQRGYRPVLAVPADHVAKAHAAGLEATAVMPPFAMVAARAGLTDDEMVERVLTDPHFLIRETLMPWLRASATVLDQLSDGAKAIVASPFLFSAPIIAEKHGVPLVSAVLQPMSQFSPYDPPQTPDFRFMARAPVGPAGLWWNRRMFALVRAVLRYRHARQVDAVRAAHGLGPGRGAVMIDAGRAAALTLGCYSPVLGPPMPDAPQPAALVGFPVFDSESGAPEALDPAIEHFLAAGPPPLVFTLGSFAVFAPGDFYASATAVSQRLGRRAILLTGQDGSRDPTGDVIRCRYAPHSLLFPRVAAIVHQGGIGTTGQALRAGKPQLVVPHMGDQPDNARRIEGLGVGRSIAARRFTVARGASELGKLLSDTALLARASHIGAQIAGENGAEAAADAIGALLR